MGVSQSPVERQTVDEILADWPEEPAEIADDVIDEYGLPDEAAPSELLWWRPGPWKRAERYRDCVPHHFPKKHTDFLKQVIDYRVPPETFDELAQFDGSVYPDRTNGELAAKCDEEAMNFLATNLAHDIITGETTVDDARQEYAVTAVKAMIGAEPETRRAFGSSSGRGRARSRRDHRHRRDEGGGQRVDRGRRRGGGGVRRPRVPGPDTRVSRQSRTDIATVADSGHVLYHRRVEIT